jgi:hypothetical protein
MSDTSQPVAGWYPDPENPAAERWWDGTGWTDHRRASTVAPASPSGSQPGPSYGGAPSYGGPSYGGVPSYGSATPAPTSPYGAPAYTAPAQQGNTLAVVGFVLALGGLIISLGGLTALAGAIVSIFALVRANRMRAAGLPFDRHGFALAGIIVGFVVFALVLAGTILGLVYLANLSTLTSDLGSGSGSFS